MTVIAWDAKTKTLAVDSLFTSGDRKTYGQKFKLLEDGRAVVVFAGDVIQGRKAISYIEQNKPLTHEMISGATIVVLYLVGRRRGRLAVYEDSPNVALVLQSEAWGTGSDFAIAAMDAGASAEEAAKIACKRSASCGGKIHVFRPE